ncbi:MAG: imidazole glycerol phosphate synthase subunit HisH [Gammaproteobacteria bacterium]|nr:imidazole glycerol phosphate synthase subunit HisH [Gammaproteobacteria bacterium]MBU1654452.1 imidazole glycerol phosphate synthase subunit HisH [Gammaproteobacteria bacterium]MBU1962610.1 imidazole glycerol phosphate synthase subunit HisH [Gammaproteobacteria bacterium]
MGQRIAVIDYGMGNLRSVSKAMEHVAGPGYEVRVTDDPAYISAADRVVFPGQGAARDCMAAIGRHHLNQALMQAAREKPFLGICMGLQVLLDHSEENGGTPLLGLYPGNVVHFPDMGLKVPHMGWNQVLPVGDHPLWTGIEPGSRFYFVHSYYVVPADETLKAAETEYGIRFPSAIAQANVFAVQFHPEKSADNGLQLLRNFVNWKP